MHQKLPYFLVWRIHTARLQIFVHFHFLCKAEMRTLSYTTNIFFVKLQHFWTISSKLSLFFTFYVLKCEKMYSIFSDIINLSMIEKLINLKSCGHFEYYTANVYRGLQGFCGDINVRGFQIYRFYMLPAFPAIFFTGKMMLQGCYRDSLHQL